MTHSATSRLHLGTVRFVTCNL